MRFNGVDIRSVDPTLSVAKEIYPGMARREVITVSGNRGETLAGIAEERAEAIVRVNIGARTREQAYKARALLAKWASASGDKLGTLEPTYWPGMAYDAIVEEISDPEFVFGHATVEITFALPRPYAYSLRAGYAKGEGTAAMNVGGSAKARPVISQKTAAEAPGLTWYADGKPFLKLRDEYTVPAGATVKADFTQGFLTVDGVHEEAQIDYQNTTWQPELTPGMHTIASTDAGKIEARWHDEWI